MVNIINISKFIELKENRPVIDVRSPIEYEKGHVPGSVNIPLFSNDERAQIGTVYKKQGSDKAVVLGESYAVPKIESFLADALLHSSDKSLIVYCFRGGMRSQRFSELLDENGFNVSRLESGYKSYRSYVQKSFIKSYPLSVLGGRTGSGKTEILEELLKKNEQVINLEKMASHRGSAFGSIGEGEQPTTEQFENCLFELLKTLSLKNKIWIEDESLNIGRVYLPADFFRQMKIAPLVVLKVSKKDRVERLCRDYAGYGKEPLIASLTKIGKKLGGDRASKALDAVQRNDYSAAASIILDYYDKCYDYGLTKKENSSIKYLNIESDDPETTASDLITI